MKELNTIANKKWEGDFSGTNPTLDSTNGVKIGDTAIDMGPLSPHEKIWRCASNVAANSKWIPVSEIEKCCIATGLINGGLLSINTSSGNTTFDIASGHGFVVNQADPDDPIITEVVWNTKSNVSATYLTSEIRSSIFINNTGSVVQTNGPVTFQNTRDYIFIGRLLHGNKTTISQVSSLPRVIYDQAAEADDLSMALGNINISGNVYTYNGANLNLNKSSGQSYRLGANYANNPALANITTDASLTALSFQYRYRDGLGGFKTSSATTSIDSNNYDTNTGTPTSLGTGSKWTIQRIYYFPGLGNTFITYGQTIYTSLASAKEAIALESPVIDPYLTAEASLRGYLIVRRATTNLSDTTNNMFVGAGKLGEVMAGGAAGGDVSGPSSATDNALARFDGTTGKLIKDGAGATLTDSGVLTVGIINGRSNVASISSTYSIQSDDNVLLCNSYSTTVTLNLPTSTGLTGKQYTIKKTDSSGNSVIVDPNGSEKIDNASILYINTQYEVKTIIANGSNWWIV